jgi:hypothetical protein
MWSVQDAFHDFNTEMTLDAALHAELPQRNNKRPFKAAF